MCVGAGPQLFFDLGVELLTTAADTVPHMELSVKTPLPMMMVTRMVTMTVTMTMTMMMCMGAFIGGAPPGNG